jgi:crossover junction endodeoxyribonuclease RusA
MDSITFRVYGNPAPKGSFTRMPNGAMLPAGTTLSRKRFADWRNDCRHSALEAMGEREPVRGCVRIIVEFQLPYPRTSIRKWQWGWWPNTKQPDIDKLIRALFDALTGIVWADDSQVAFVTANKVYAWNDKPGAIIVVDFVSDEWLRNLGNSQRQIINVLESL